MPGAKARMRRREGAEAPGAKRPPKYLAAEAQERRSLARKRLAAEVRDARRKRR